MFELVMNSIDLSELLAYLLSHETPVTEPELLKRFVPGSEHLMLEGVSLELYRAHFTLYHHLYRLSAALDGTGYRLHVRLIYVYVFRRPGPGNCCYFTTDPPGFCLLRAEEGSRYCTRHRALEERLLIEGAVEQADLSGFYLDEKNSESFDEERLRKFEREIYFYAANHREVDRCLEVMGLSADYSPERLRSRYRYLSKLHHPDARSNGTFAEAHDVPFSEITNAYTVLRRLRS